ncbi:MAG TPA: FtsW/RodA/SpoVE family cell cycle protein, partial [Clostridium sp.]|nr:FtsW/RodA/SpoVE family cell cycle protein [Clostridium sp.]
MYSLSDKNKKKKFKFDYILFGSVFLLSIFGIIVLCSATATMPGGNRMVMTQIVSMILGIGICLVINFLDYNIFKSLSGLMYIFGVLLLVLVLRIGVEVSESRRWIIIPIINMSFQPSELTKIFFILFISKHFEKLVKEFNKV